MGQKDLSRGPFEPQYYHAQTTVMCLQMWSCFLAASCGLTSMLKSGSECHILNDNFSKSLANAVSELKAKIERRPARVAIIGLGYCFLQSKSCEWADTKSFRLSFEIHRLHDQSTSAPKHAEPSLRAQSHHGVEGVETMAMLEANCVGAAFL